MSSELIEVAYAVDGDVTAATPTLSFRNADAGRAFADVILTDIEAPGSPTAVGADAVDAEATVFFTAPADGGPVGSYTVYATDLTDPANGGQTATGTASPITITGLTNGDQYTFTVTATNTTGESAPSDLSAPVRPIAVPGAPADAAAVAGDAAATVSFTAPADGSPVDSYTVYATDLTDPANGGQTATGTASPITITGLTNGHQYTFTVTATNTAGESAPSDLSAPVVPNVPPPGVPTDAAAVAGDAAATVSFTAPADGGPIDSYAVYATDLTDPANGGQTATGTASPITITGLTNGDQYVFTVTATNVVAESGQSAATAAITPNVPAPGAPTDVDAVAGDAEAIVSFTAPVDGGPVDSYTVYATDLTDPANGGQTATGSTSPITITGLTNGDQYTFTVTATNTASESAESAPSESVTPQVPAPGVPAGASAGAGDAAATVSFTAPIDGGPVDSYTVYATDLTDPANGGQTATGSTSPITITGLTNGDQYTFTVTATNAAGESTPSTETDVVTPQILLPGAPTSVSAAPADLSAAVSFTAPVDGGRVDTYTVYATDLTDPANGGQTATGTASPITITGLTNGDRYTFIVTATNTTGESGESAPSNVVVPDPGAPGTPLDPSAAAGDTTATVSFDPPIDGGPVDTYTVYATDLTNPANGGQTATGSTSPITITGLTNGDQYTFTVTATNAAGESTPSTAADAVTPQVPLPGAPLATGAAAGNGAATVSFSAPVDGGPVDSYTVYANDLTDPADGGQTATGGTSPITITGLTNGDQYTFTITATNAAGESTPSDPTQAVTPIAIPARPTAVTATAGDTEATISFAPGDGGGPVDLFTVQAIDLTTTANGGQTATGTASPITVTGLTNLDQYVFRVVAGNASGSSVASNPSNAAVPRIPAPGTPTGATARPGDTVVTVSFTAPVDGGPVDSYTVYATDLTNPANGGQTSTGTASPITITGLTNGDQYTFTVTTTNSTAESAESAPSNATTPRIDVPGTPIGATATAGDTVVTVSFTAPVDGGPVGTYTVYASDLTNPANGGQTSTGTASPITITGLTNGDQYTFTVTATNTTGESTPSTATDRGHAQHPRADTSRRRGGTGGRRPGNDHLRCSDRRWSCRFVHDHRHRPDRPGQRWPDGDRIGITARHHRPHQRRRLRLHRHGNERRRRVRSLDADRERDTYVGRGLIAVPERTRPDGFVALDSAHGCRLRRRCNRRSRRRRRGRAAQGQRRHHGDLETVGRRRRDGGASRCHRHGDQRRCGRVRRLLRHRSRPTRRCRYAIGPHGRRHQSHRQSGRRPLRSLPIGHRRQRPRYHDRIDHTGVRTAHPHPRHGRQRCRCG